MVLDPRVLVLLGCVCVGVACESDKASGPTGSDSEATASLPALDTAAAARAVEAIASAPEDAKGTLAARALSELEEKRLGASFAKGLRSLSEASPDQRAMQVAEAIEANISMLDAACEADARKTMGALATMEPSERGEMLWSACKFDRLGLISKEEGKAFEPMTMLLAHMAFVTLKNAGAVDANERALLLMLARSPVE